MKKFYYFAYGANITSDEMLKYIPEAKFIGYSELKNYALRFMGYDGHAILTIYPKKGDSVPIAIWDFPSELRYSLANHEQLPYIYHHKNVKAYIGNTKYHGVIYVPNQKLPSAKPSKAYLNLIKKNYLIAKFDINKLEHLLLEQEKEK